MIQGDGVSSTFDVNNVVLLCMLEHLVGSIIIMAVVTVSERHHDGQIHECRRTRPG